MPAPPAPSDRAAEPRADSVDTGADPPGREIVVGVDGSELGMVAVRWAAQEAERRAAPLKILHAADYLGRPGADGSPPPELRRARRITALAYTTAKHTAPGVQSSAEVVSADPTTALLQASSAAQLLVLGSSATGAADEMVLASIAVHVAARSPQPVVVVPRGRGEPAGRPVVAVLGVGDADDDEAVAEEATAAATRMGASLLVLQTRPTKRHVTTWVDDPAEWGRRFPDLEVEHRDMPSARANQVVSATCPSPLMVINAGRGSLLHRSLDAPHLWLLRHCTSPMQLVPPVHRSGRHEEDAASG
jgi:nucleotide-binding universal stress UspA family protein